MSKKKMKSSFVNMVVILTVISVISGLLLGFTYTTTKPAIEQVAAKKQLKAIKAVVPEFDNNPSTEKYTLKEFEGVEFFPAKKGGQTVGVAVKTFSNKAFNGNIELMVGFDTKGAIHNISVLKQAETPGLGTKMTEPKFKSQFNKKNPESFKLEVKKDGGDVDAITAATISSRAFCDAADRAFKAFKKGGIR